MTRSTSPSLAALVGTLLAAVPSLWSQGYIVVSPESWFEQTGATTTTANGFKFFAAAEDVDGVTGGTVTATAGTFVTPTALPNVQGSLYEYESTPASAGALITAYPLDATYTFNLTGGSGGPVVIAGPGGTLAERTAAAPLFTFSGITGVWSGSTFTFDPTGVTSFSVTLAGFDVSIPGSLYSTYISVADVSGSYNQIGEASSGVVAPGSYADPVLTFTQGLALNGGDGDDNTYGFVDGSQIKLEAGQFNVIDPIDAGFGDGSIAGFTFGSVTSFTLIAASPVPEPSTYAALLGGAALLSTAVRRRRQRA